MQWYWEGSHYKEKTGDLVLDRVFDIEKKAPYIPEDFGVMITTESIEDHLLKIKHEQTRYALSNGKDIDEIQELIDQITK